MTSEIMINNDNASVNINVKTPKRIIHYGDGVVEEYSEDESDGCQINSDVEPAIDPSTLTWMPWFRYKFWTAGNKTISVIDYVGETIAYVLGITSPKYQLEINEYNRMQQRLRKSQEETKGWIANENGVTTTDQPSTDTTTVTAV